MYLGQAFTIPTEYEDYKTRMGIFGLVGGTVNHDIITFYFDKFGGDIGFKEREAMGKIILPLYQEKIAAGKYPPFEFHEFKRTGINPTESAQLTREITDQTGFNYLFVWNYLAILESLAKAGVIDYKHYDPKLSDLKTITEPHVWQELKSKVPALIDALPAAGRGAISIQKNLTILAGIGLGTYLLFTANKFIKRNN